jgi:phosphatidylserine/phosphatidylglycerophosphate/cardiolipin synthase-like enzyme
MIAGCASLPPLEGRTAKSVFADTAGTRLGRAVAVAVEANTGKTGVHPLLNPHDAFAARMNRPMHSKPFTVDKQVSVVGGRNICNEYFGAGSGIIFADLDVIAVGTAVPEVSKEFDLYWSSPSAYPAASFVRTPGPDGTANLEARFASMRARRSMNSPAQARRRPCTRRRSPWTAAVSSWARSTSTSARRD